MSEEPAPLCAVIPRLTAVVDGAVELQCNLSVPASNHDKDNVTLVLWSKSDVHGPLYSVDARNTPLERAKHFPSPELAGRYEFNTSTHPAVLRVDPVRLEDAGEFKCRVDFRWARTHTFVLALQVIGELPRCFSVGTFLKADLLFHDGFLKILY